MLCFPTPFIKGIFLGFGAAAPLGPVNVQIARRTLHYGFLSGFSLGCGAVSVDILYAVLSTVGVGHFADDRRIILPLTAAGVLMLTYLGVRCIQSGLRPAPAKVLSDAADEQDDPARPPRQPLLRSYSTGLLMTLLNPMTLAFWFIAVPAFASDLSFAGVHSRTLAPPSDPPTGERWHLPMICAGVFVATLSWVVIFAGLLAIARLRRRDWWLRTADLAGGMMLLCVAGATLWRSIHAFL